MRIIDWSSDVCSSDLSAVKVADGDYRIVFTAEETNKAIQITGDSGATLAALNVSADNGATFSTELQPHQPARLYLDGIITVIERDTNEIDDLIDAITLDLYKAEAGTTITLEKIRRAACRERVCHAG